VIETITLAPTSSTNPRYAFSDGTVTLTAQPGGSRVLFGRHRSALRSSHRHVSEKQRQQGLTVTKPTYTVLQMV